MGMVEHCHAVSVPGCYWKMPMVKEWCTLVKLAVRPHYGYTLTFMRWSLLQGQLERVWRDGASERAKTVRYE